MPLRRKRGCREKILSGVVILALQFSVGAVRIGEGARPRE